LEDHLKAKMPIRNNKITTSNGGGIEKACWKHFESLTLSWIGNHNVGKNNIQSSCEHEGDETYKDPFEIKGSN
jgi:hypothetical protein